MITRKIGTSKFSGNFEIGSAAPIDSRMRVQNKIDLYNPGNWDVFAYPGMVVVVYDDTDTSNVKHPENNGMYIFDPLMKTGAMDVISPSNWKKGSNSTEFAVSGIDFKGEYVPGDTYMKGDLVTITETGENPSSYGYVCRTDNTTGIDPLTNPDSWMKFFLVGSEGKTGKDGFTPYIENNKWFIDGHEKGKSVYIPSISSSGYWQIDEEMTNPPVLARGINGDTGIANINYTGLYDPTYNYVHEDEDGNTDVCVGSDDSAYYCLSACRGVNPVTDTSNNNWVLFVMHGAPGDPGDSPYIKADGYWYIETNGVEKPLGEKARGSIVSINNAGYWVIDDEPQSTRAQGLIGLTGPQGPDGQQGVTGPEGPEGATAIANLNYLGEWRGDTTYVHTDAYGKTDVVTGQNGNAYYCKVTSLNISPCIEQTPGVWVFNPAASAYWVKFVMVGARGIQGIEGPEGSIGPDGPTGGQGPTGNNGMHGGQPFIDGNGEWAINHIGANGKVYNITYLHVKAEGITPHIANGYWYIGDDDDPQSYTGVRAIGESAIANLNYLGAWDSATPYYHSNLSQKGWTDVVIGADGLWYYAKTDSTNQNPSKQIDIEGVLTWVTDTSKSAYWAVFTTKGPRGNDGNNVRLRKVNGWIQWQYVGSSTWTNLVELSEIKGEANLSDISTPIGSIIMWSGKADKIPIGYLLADGSTALKATYPQLVEALTGGNVAVQATLPDLRGRFIVGYTEDGSTSYDISGPFGIIKDGTLFTSIGNTGGKNQVKLGLSEIPSHKHSVLRDDSSSGSTYKYPGIALNNSNNAPDTGMYTESAGGSNFHENRPPFYVLAYIIKAKYIGEVKTPYDTYLSTLTEGEIPLTKIEWLDTMRGQTGVAGITYKGDYDNGTQYFERDVIRISDPLNPQYGNAFYCKVPGETGINGIEPGDTADWALSWSLFVLKGADGKPAELVDIIYSTESSVADMGTWHSTPALNDVYARFSVAKTAEGVRIYSNPVKFKGDIGLTGYDLKVQYSVDGVSTNFHDLATASDKYIRFSTDNGTSWSVGMQLSTTSTGGSSDKILAPFKIKLPSTAWLGRFNGQRDLTSNDIPYSIGMTDGWTIPDFLKGIAFEATAPTGAISSPSIVAYGTTIASIELSASFTITTPGVTAATTDPCKIEYRVNNTGSWLPLTSSPILTSGTTYTYTYTDINRSFPAAAHKVSYQAIFTDSNGMSVTTIAKDITSGLYINPAISGSIVTATGVDIGDVASGALSFTITDSNVNSKMKSFKISYSTDGGITKKRMHLDSYAMALINITEDNSFSFSPTAANDRRLLIDSTGKIVWNSTQFDKSADLKSSSQYKIYIEVTGTDPYSSGSATKVTTIEIYSRAMPYKFYFGSSAIGVIPPPNTDLLTFLGSINNAPNQYAISVPGTYTRTWSASGYVWWAYNSAINYPTTGSIFREGSSTGFELPTNISAPISREFTNSYGITSTYKFIRSTNQVASSGSTLTIIAI